MGKTTLLFNIAVALGEIGKKVIVVDGDAQANSTALGLTEDQYKECLDRNETIWAAVSPLVSGAGDVQKVPPRQIRGNVWLLPGDIRLSHFEAICPVGWTEALAGEARGFRVTSAFYRLLKLLEQIVQADLALVDLGPNVNALNRSVLIASDGFVVPLAPDLFSLMALPSVGTSLKTWITQWNTAVGNKPADLDIPIPRGRPVPIGYISQQFSTYRKSPSAAFQQWLEKIPEAYQEGVVQPLQQVSVPIPPGDGSLGTLQNYGALIPTSQESNKAIFELTGREAYGAQFTRAQDSRGIFISLANAIGERLP